MEQYTYDMSPPKTVSTCYFGDKKKKDLHFEEMKSVKLIFFERMGKKIKMPQI